MPYGKTQKEAKLRVRLKHALRRKGIRGWTKKSPTARSKKLLASSRG